MLDVAAAGINGSYIFMAVFIAFVAVSARAYTFSAAFAQQEMIILFQDFKPAFAKVSLDLFYRNIKVCHYVKDFGARVHVKIIFDFLKLIFIIFIASWTYSEETAGIIV